jgi:hypothetical protein
VVGEEASASELAALETERRAHDALLESTAEMAGQLKQRMLLAQSALRADNATLDLTDDAMSANAAKVDAEARRIQATRRAMRANCCTNWLIALAVILLFVTTLIFIRIFPAPPRR